jgi:membrane protease subunit (stomatin/prohibitin family)
VVGIGAGVSLGRALAGSMTAAEIEGSGGVAAAASAQKFCTACGKPMGRAAKFCPECGTAQ